jgi:hypothetical protein
MSTTPFEDPAESSNIEYQPLIGSLLLFEVVGYEPHIQTKFTLPGEQNPAVRVNMTVIEGPHAGEQYPNGLVFPKRLQGQLRPRVGKMVLGRLQQGKAETGKTAPWELQSATEADKQLAGQVIARGASGPAPTGVPAAGEPPF